MGDAVLIQQRTNFIALVVGYPAQVKQQFRHPGFLFGQVDERRRHYSKPRRRTPPRGALEEFTITPPSPS
jgi:hypothetical protein